MQRRSYQPVYDHVLRLEPLSFLLFFFSRKCKGFLFKPFPVPNLDARLSIALDPTDNEYFQGM